MNEAGHQNLLERDVVRSRLDDGALPDWAAEQYETFRESMFGERNDTEFPCYFGVQSEADGDALYTFVDSTTGKDALFALRDTLLEYLEVFDDYSERCSLVTFFAPDPDARTEADYHERLWHVLQFLHVYDPEPWPADIPTDPEDPYFEWSFGGEPFFPTCRAPFHTKRPSRRNPVGMEITFQPRAVFEGVTADTAAGQAARDVIQGRLEDYDGACPHAAIGDWGVEGDREWPQYLLWEDREQAPETCPLTVDPEPLRASSPAAD
jgi:FPC/CPF motif-containing protein YcgG